MTSSSTAELCRRDVTREVVIGKRGVNESPAPPTNLPGAAGKETWTFKALKPGSSTVSFDYSRPWAGGEKATWRFVLTVTAT
jgi:predicted secreted protein